MHDISLTQDTVLELAPGLEEHVDDSLRGLGMGRALMEEAEDEARRRGCRLVMGLTYDVLISDFYDRLGYRTVGAIEDCPKGTTTRWYRKDLVPEPATSSVR